MTTSEPTRRKRRDPGPQPRLAFVWVWLPGATDPVVAGRLDVRANRSSGLLSDVSSTITFTYGSSYLARPDAISLYSPELPLRSGRQEPRAGQTAKRAPAISSTGARDSRLQVCRDAAPEYNLSLADANAIIDHTVSTIEDQWAEAADATRLTDLERELFKGRQILNPFIRYT